MAVLKVKLKILEHAYGLPLPSYESEGAAGLDLRAAISENEELNIKPHMRLLVPTGIIIELPLGYEAQIRPRSGLAIKSGITLLNSPGTIDSDYRGEIKIILINHSLEEFKIQRGDRIAQMVVQKVQRIRLVEDELSNTDRSDGGFGSTGVN